MKQSVSPKVTVLMPVYNAEKYCKASIESILKQTFSDFEFIIINDGSHDNSSKIIEYYQGQDSRIKVLTNKYNLGVARALNKGIQNSQANYIARMDADDIAFPCKLEKQVRFLDQRPDIAVLGTQTIIIDDNSNVIEVRNLASDSLLIKWNLYFYCALAHPTVMIRRSMISNIGGYSKRFQHAEDYELWLRANSEYKFYNLSEPLLYYRVHEHNMSVLFNDRQHQSCISLLQGHISKLIDEPVNSEMIKMLRLQSTTYNLTNAYHLIQKMYKKFLIKNNLNMKEDINLIRKDMYKRLLRIAQFDKSYKHRLIVFLQVINKDLMFFISILFIKIRKLLQL